VDGNWLFLLSFFFPSLGDLHGALCCRFQQPLDDSPPGRDGGRPPFGRRIEGRHHGPQEEVHGPGGGPAARRPAHRQYHGDSIIDTGKWLTRPSRPGLAESWVDIASSTSLYSVRNHSFKRSGLLLKADLKFGGKVHLKPHNGARQMHNLTEQR
jgi:hypothetical protein